MDKLQLDWLGDLVVHRFTSHPIDYKTFIQDTLLGFVINLPMKKVQEYP